MVRLAEPGLLPALLLKLGCSESFLSRCFNKRALLSADDNYDDDDDDTLRGGLSLYSGASRGRVAFFLDSAPSQSHLLTPLQTTRPWIAWPMRRMSPIPTTRRSATGPGRRPWE